MKVRKFSGFILAFLIFLALGLNSCQKNNYLGFTPGKGSPVITSVHTYARQDSVGWQRTITTMDSTGDTSSTSYNQSGAYLPFDSVTNAGNLGEYYLIEGSNLGSATSVTFNGTIAYFDRAMVTDHSILVQIPGNVPFFGPQATDSLMVTTLYGKAYYKFSIIPPPPTVSAVSNYDFYAGSQISLKGVGFSSVTSVGLSGSKATCTIVSQTDTTMTIQFPSSTVSQANLIFTYGGGTVTSTQEFVDLDNALPIFTDNFGPNWGSWSWGPSGSSTQMAKTGTASFSAQYGANSWWIDGFRAGGGGPTDGVPFSAGYNYLVFWVYGGSVDEKIYIEFGNEGFANGGANEINEYDVPPGVWTYYKIPISASNSPLLWNTGPGNWSANSSQYLNTVAFFMNSNSVKEQLYFDDVVLVK